MQYWCSACEISSQAKLEFVLKEQFSYSPEINITVSSFSSIPGSISMAASVISADDEEIFIGANSSEFYFIMTPSLFISNIPGEPSLNTGYHVSVQTPPSPGSQYIVQDLPIVTQLSALVYLSSGNYGLLTKRYYQQSMFSTISSLLGSIVGVMGALVFVMRTLERNMQNALEKRKRTVIKEHIREQRKEIIRELRDDISDDQDMKTGNHCTDRIKI